MMRPPVLFLFLLLPLLLAAQAAQAAEEGRTRDSSPCASGTPAAAQAGCDRVVLYRCLGDLPQERQEKANAIVTEAMPTLEDLDQRISLKMDELQGLTFSESGDAENLPRLGLDLQLLRNQLREALMQVNMRLQQEVGVQLPPPGRGCRSMRVYHTGE